MDGRLCEQGEFSEEPQHTNLVLLTSTANRTTFKETI